MLNRLRSLFLKLLIPKLLIGLTAIVVIVFLIFGLSLLWEQATGFYRSYAKQGGIAERGFAMGVAVDPPTPAKESVADTYTDLGHLADIALIEEPIQWSEYLDWKGQETKQTRRIKEKAVLSRRQGLKICLILDPLNATDHGSPNFPNAWDKKNFSSTEVKNVYQRLAVKLANDINPEYLGLASEINTYYILNPLDFDNLALLYKGTYQDVKESHPKTKVFVTWQYEDLQGLWWWDEVHKGIKNTKLVKDFDDYIDLFAITTYPGLVYESSREIPKDFYSRANSISSKKLAIVESGWSTEDSDNGVFHGTEADQALYVALMPTFFEKVKPEFWIYRLMYDLDLESYKPVFAESQMDPAVMSVFSTMGLKDTDGEEKSAFRNWHNTYTNEQGRNI